MFKINVALTMGVLGLALGLAAAAGAQQGGGAAASTKDINAGVAQQLPLADKQDFEDARRGFIAPLPDSGIIRDKDGRPVWDLSGISFIKEGAAAPETVNPSLWRQSQLLTYACLFKVSDRVYQVRGADASNITFIEGDTGIIVSASADPAHRVRMGLSRFTTHSLQTYPQAESVQRVLAAALEAVEPAAAVRRCMQRQGDRLVIAGRAYDLNRYRRVLIVGAGKAGYPMASEAARLVADKLSGGILVVKEGHSGEVPGITMRQAGHPLPDERGVRAMHEIIDLLREAGEDDLVICLISGGGSALLTAHATGLQLADLQEMTRLLLACGANIGEINTLRKHLDEVKGGRLARHAYPAQLVTLILSDVIGDPLDAIASGPTVADPTTYQDDIQVLERYGIWERTPPAILAFLERGQAGEVPETPKPGEPGLEGSQNVVIANNLSAAEAVLEQATRRRRSP